MYYVYILSNWNEKVYYTGFTNDIYRRVIEHRQKLNRRGFTAKYNVSKLLYFEEVDTVEEGLHREQQVKRYPRKWKDNLIRSINPEREDLFGSFIEKGYN